MVRARDARRGRGDGRLARRLLCSAGGARCGDASPDGCLHAARSGARKRGGIWRAQARGGLASASAAGRGAGKRRAVWRAARAKTERLGAPPTRVTRRGHGASRT